MVRFALVALGAVLATSACTSRGDDSAGGAAAAGMGAGDDSAGGTGAGGSSAERDSGPPRPPLDIVAPANESGSEPAVSACFVEHCPTPPLGTACCAGDRCGARTGGGCAALPDTCTLPTCGTERTFEADGKLELLAARQRWLRAIVFGNGDVFWSDHGNVVYCAAKACYYEDSFVRRWHGGAVRVVLPHAVHSLRHDGSTLYAVTRFWVDGWLYRWDEQGGPRRVDTATRQQSTAFAATSTHLFNYWWHRPNFGSAWPNEHRLYSRPKSAQHDEPWTEHSLDGVGASFASAADQIYFPYRFTHIGRMGPDGVKEVVAGPIEGDIGQLAIDGSTLYAVVRGEGDARVLAVSIPSGSVTPIYATGRNVVGLAASSGRVALALTDEDDCGSIVVIGHPAGTVRTVALDQPGTTAVTIDSEHVAWTNQGVPHKRDDGTVMRLRL